MLVDPAQVGICLPTLSARSLGSRAAQVDAQCASADAAGIRNVGRSEPGDRRLPGDGEIDLAALLGSLDAMGCSLLVVSEVYSQGLLRQLGPKGLARAATAATRRVLSLGDRWRGGPSG